MDKLKQKINELHFNIDNGLSRHQITELDMLDLLDLAIDAESKLNKAVECLKLMDKCTLKSCLGCPYPDCNDKIAKETLAEITTD